MVYDGPADAPEVAVDIIVVLAHPGDRGGGGLSPDLYPARYGHSGRALPYSTAARLGGSRVSSYVVTMRDEDKGPHHTHLGTGGNITVLEAPALRNSVAVDIIVVLAHPDT